MIQRRPSIYVGFTWYCRGVSESELPVSTRIELPERHVTVNQVVAYNMAAFRRASNLTQEELGERVGGWSPASVSAAERSWDSSRVKKFDADELIAIAEALVIPLPALFLPPEDDGVMFEYMLDLPYKSVLLRAALPLVFGAFAYDSPAMSEYRRRLIATGWRYRPLAELEMDLETDLEQARRRADRLLRQAEEVAEAVTDTARERASSIERDALERHRQAVAGLEAERKRLERRVEGLRAFERQYRSSIRDHLDGVLRAFLAPGDRADTDEVIASMHQRAAEKGASAVTAVMLDEDGTYAIYRADQTTETDAQDEDTDGRDERAAGEGQRLPAVLLP